MSGARLQGSHAFLRGADRRYESVVIAVVVAVVVAIVELTADLTPRELHAVDVRIGPAGTDQIENL